MERNLEEDFERCFKDKVPHVIAIGIMTDSDNTKSSSLAYFDEVRISRLSAAQRSRVDLPEGR
jgi:hypothetical protein